jgi:hypothetical protein
MTTILKFSKQAFLTLFLLTTLTGNASHNAGMAITYTYTGTPNSYLVRFYFYRDLTGIPAPSQINVCYSSASCAQSGSVLLLPIVGTGQAITLGPCITIGGAFGIEEWIFEGVVNLPMACTDWIFSYSECCRAGGIMNIQAGGMFVYATLDNVNFPTNSSPFFINPVYSQHCIFSNTNRSFTCVDIDGDSLVYELAPALDGSSCPATSYSSTYITPYTPQSPFSSSTPIILDASTGNLNFTPNIIQIAAVGVAVKEYRNGQLVGQIHSDNYITSVNVLLATDNMTGKVYHDLNLNSVYDAGEPGMANQIMEVQPGPYYYTSNPLGNYNALLPLGNFTAYTYSNYPYYYFTPSSHAASFPSGNMIDSLNDFGFGTTVTA